MDLRPKRLLAVAGGLLDALAEQDVTVRGGPVTLQYDDPWTPPFMRRNEVAVTVESPD